MKHLETFEDRAVSTVSNIILVIVAFLAIYPLFFVVIASVSDPYDVMNGEVWFWPNGFTLKGYEKVMADDRIWTGYANSVFYTVTATFLNVVVTMSAAFALSRKDLPGKGKIMTFFMITMFFGGGTVPTYLLMKNLHLLDNRLVMIIPGLVTVWNMVIARTNIQSNIPDELIEAATIDGCSYYACFFKIILPLSKAIMSVLVLYYGVGHWNAFFGALLYLSDSSKYPLQLILRDILIQTQMTSELMADSQAAQTAMQDAELMKYSVVIVASIPMLVLYPFLQKYFVKGVMVGAIKG
ncbi:MAG: carbohydrate ABC transporter permease [Clostridia bacterium]|nr:carbohydrate ABC transporter permease [Clostridia bacterium]